MKDYFLNVELGDVCDIISGKNQKEVENPNGEYPIYGSGGIFGFANNYLCEPGTTVIGRKGTINSPIYVNEKFWNVDTAFGISPFYPIVPKYINFFCQGFNFKQLDKSTTIPSLAKRDLLKIQLPIAPLPLQRALVVKIEELFSSLDSGITNLKNAQKQIKVYKQAVLKKAFDGSLIDGSVFLKKLLKEVVCFTQGIQVSIDQQKIACSEQDIRFLRIIDFTQGKDEQRFIRKPETRHIVKKDDISMVRYGASTGFVCTGIEGAIANNIFRIIPQVQIKKRLLYYFFNSPQFVNEMSKKIKGAAMPAISFNLLNEMPIKYPPDVNYQNQLVQKIESLFTICNAIEIEIQNSLKKAEALRQSILKKAFEGKLLSPEEIEKCKSEYDYEPASILLEKIEAEKKKK